MASRPMPCKQHPTVPATDRCTSCAEAFCPYCLVEVSGLKFCGSCKVMALGQPEPIDGTRESETVAKALKYAVIGIFCFGIVLGPMAIAAALEAKRELRQNPQLAGLAKANIALALGIMDLCWNALAAILTVTGRGG